MQTRRSILRHLAVGAAAGLFPAGRAQATPEASRPSPGADTAPASAPATASTEPPPDCPPPWELLQPLAAGDPVGLGWSIESLSRVRSGASVLVLRRGAEQARVHICLRQGLARGVAFTPTLDLIVMNGGHGDTLTEESLGRVLIGLAPTLTRNEARAAGAIAFLKGHEERLRTYGAIALQALS